MTRAWTRSCAACSVRKGLIFLMLCSANLQDRAVFAMCSLKVSWSSNMNKYRIVIIKSTIPLSDTESVVLTVHTVEQVSESFLSLSLSFSGTHAFAVDLLSSSRAGLRAELWFTTGHKQHLHTLVSTGTTPDLTTHTTAGWQCGNSFAHFTSKYLKIEEKKEINILENIKNIYLKYFYNTINIIFKCIIYFIILYHKCIILYFLCNKF